MNYIFLYLLVTTLTSQSFPTYPVTNVEQKVSIESLQKEIDSMMEDSLSDGKSLSLYSVAPEGETMHLSVSAYTTAPDECGPGKPITSSGTEPIVGKTVAASKDLKHLIGEKIWIEGIGTRTVEDSMSSRYKKTLDVLMHTKKDAFKWGRKNQVKVVKIAD